MTTFHAPPHNSPGRRGGAIIGHAHCLDVASGWFCVIFAIAWPLGVGTGSRHSAPGRRPRAVPVADRVEARTRGAPSTPGACAEGPQGVGGWGLVMCHSHTGMVAHSNTGAGVASKPRHPATQQPSQTPNAHFHNRLTPHKVSPKDKPPPPRAHVFAVCGPHRPRWYPPAPVVSTRLRYLRAGGRRRERTHPRCATRGGLQAFLWE